MAIAFAAFTSLAAVGAAWVVALHESARYAAMVLLGVFGLALLVPAVGECLSRPLVALGARLTGAGANGRTPSVLLPVALGVGTGLLWAPCAGPILGLLLTGAALNGANLGTSLLLLAFAAGAGRRWRRRCGRAWHGVCPATFPAVPKACGASRARPCWRASPLRRSGLDTGMPARIPTPGTTQGWSKGLVERLQRTASPAKPATAQGPLVGPVRRDRMDQRAGPAAGRTPGQGGAGQLLDLFVHQLPAHAALVRAWDEKYRDAGLVVSASTRPSSPSRSGPPTCAGPSPTWDFAIPSRWTTTSAYGVPSRTVPGPASTSSTAKGACATRWPESTPTSARSR